MKIVLSTSAQKSLRRLARSDHRLFQRVVQALKKLARKPEEGKPLQGRLRGLRSWRVGQIRIVYQVIAERLEIFVLSIGQRGAVYRDLP